MSVPMEPVLESRRGRYETNRVGDEGGLPTHTKNPNVVQRKLDNFRDYVGDNYCSCVSRMPAIVLVIIICLMFALILALIPAIFVLVNAISSESEALVSSDLDLPGTRVGFNLSDVNALKVEEEEDDDLTGPLKGISISSIFPPNVSACPGFGFSCTNDPHIIVGTYRRCDGISDCPDGSDEVGCVECQTAFSCRLNPEASMSDIQICLRSHNVCDDVRQCPDGSDEALLCSRDCEEDELQCMSVKGTKSLCVPSQSRCDGVRDCADGSDEQDCNSCNRGAVLCPTTNKCIDSRFVCDGVSQCPDGSDEKACDCRGCCGSDKALCDDGTCIDRHRICDGVNDCFNGMDEKNCPGLCSFSEDPLETVVCTDGLTYNMREACSGEYEQCAEHCTECDKELAFTCSNDKCIPRRKVCDGHLDCPDGLDEEDCDCEDKYTCLGGKQCIDEARRCDGVADCSNGSDEMECDKCAPDALRCDLDKSCIHKSMRCDGIADCSDGSDETGCSCFDCVGQHSRRFMCETSGRCFRKDEVCSPYSVCPNATMSDKGYCAMQAVKDLAWI